jgi:hypothetical protein
MWNLLTKLRIEFEDAMQGMKSRALERVKELPLAR